MGILRFCAEPAKVPASARPQGDRRGNAKSCEPAHLAIEYNFRGVQYSTE